MGLTMLSQIHRSSKALLRRGRVTEQRNSRDLLHLLYQGICIASGTHSSEPFPDPGETMAHAGILDRLVRGAAAGFAGTLALQVMRTASETVLPTTMPPIRQDPGEYMLQKAEERLPASMTSRIPAAAEAAAAKGLAAGYGVTAGAVYGLLRPAGGDVLTDGIALGVGTWAAGYLGWLPALGLLPPLREQHVAEAVGPIVRHALFGIAVVATYGALASRLPVRREAAMVRR